MADQEVGLLDVLPEVLPDFFLRESLSVNKIAMDTVSPMDKVQIWSGNALQDVVVVFHCVVQKMIGDRWGIMEEKDPILTFLSHNLSATLLTMLQEWVGGGKKGRRIEQGLIIKYGLLLGPEYMRHLHVAELASLLSMVLFSERAEGSTHTVGTSVSWEQRAGQTKLPVKVRALWVNNDPESTRESLPPSGDKDSFTKGFADMFLGELVDGIMNVVLDVSGILGKIIGV
ncbi:hypothetical protein EDD16DRAFT_1527235 [Pisolithus croceorrhizus]|nr:hypothetical protein EDD16DRAFT_1527235 [Pisolithus croceorrhizus]KAI6106293.1 hypothetical protein EV401DRAFT_1892688 [Pisolithus croceorrhizus]